MPEYIPQAVYCYDSVRLGCACLQANRVIKAATNQGLGAPPPPPPPPLELVLPDDELEEEDELLELEEEDPELELEELELLLEEEELDDDELEELEDGPVYSSAPRS